MARRKSPARGRNGRFTKGGARKRRTTKKRATRKRKTARRKSTTSTSRKKPTRRRRKRSTEGEVVKLFKQTAPIVAGIVGAGMLARAGSGYANTPTKRALLVGGAALVGTLGATRIARMVPFVNATVVRGAMAGFAADAIFRGTYSIRQNAQLLPAAARRPGGLLAGRPRTTRSARGSYAASSRLAA